VRFKNLYLFGIRRNCLRSGRSRSLYLSIRRAIKQVIVIIGAYQFDKYVQTFIQHPALKLNSICRGIIGDHECGFRCNWLTTDHIFCIRQILEKKGEYNEAVHQIFMDFKKAYDFVRRGVLYNILIEFGIPMKLVRLLKCV
jgi:hypothetical protein